MELFWGVVEGLEVSWGLAEAAGMDVFAVGAGAGSLGLEVLEGVGETGLI
jgi:hypothetical protein